MKKGDYQTPKKAEDYKTKRFAQGLSTVNHDEISLLKKVIQEIKFSLSPQIVDLGTGTGRFIKTLSKIKGAKIVAIDQSKEMLDILKRDHGELIKKGIVETIQADVKKIPIKKNTSELTTAFHLFKHLDDPGSIIHQISKATKKGGYVFFDIINQKSIANLYLESCQAITVQKIDKVLKNEGFTPIKHFYLHNFGETIYKILGIKIGKIFNKVIDTPLSKMGVNIGTKIFILAKKK